MLTKCFRLLACVVFFCFGALAARALTISKDLAGASVIKGQSLTLSVDVTGTAPYSCKWYHKAPGATSASLVSGASGLSLPLSFQSRADMGLYYVEVTDASAATIKSAGAVFIEVNAPDASCAVTPANPQVANGAGVTLAVSSAIPSAGWSYQWRFNGVALAGKTAATLELSNLAKSNSGFYDVVITSALSQVTPTAAVVEVSPAQVINDFAVDPSYVVRTQTESCSFDGLLNLASGKTLAWGVFNELDGVTRYNLVRFNSDGSLDTTFPDFPGGSIRAVVELQDGRLVVLRASSAVAGDMALAVYSSAGVFQQNLSHLLAPDGIAPTMTRALDGGVYLVESFRVTTGDFVVGRVRKLTSGLALDTSFTSLTISQDGADVGLGCPLELLPDGKVILAGSFTKVGGVARGSIARLMPDGTLDTTIFASAGFVGGVASFKALAEGGYLVSGSYISYNGVAVPSLFKLAADGSLSSTAVAAKPFPGGTVNRIYPQADGRILVSGWFSSLADGSLDGSLHGIAMLNTDGSMDTGFISAVGALAGPSFYSLGGVTASGRLLIGGIASGYAWLDKSTLATTRGAARSPSAPWYVLPGPGNTLYVAGSFTRAQGVATKGLVRLLANGSIDTGFLPTLDFSLANGLVVQSDGSVVVIEGYGLLKRYSSAGVLDTTYNPGSFIGDLHLTALPGDRVLISACWWSGPGIPVIVNKDGSLDANFVVATDAYGSCQRIAAAVAQPDGKILFGGTGNDTAGSNLGATVFNFMARLNPDGSRDTTLTDAGSLAWPNTLLLQGSGKILAATKTNLAVLSDKGVLLNPAGTVPAGYSSTLYPSGDGGAFVCYGRGLPGINEAGTLESSMVKVAGDGNLKPFGFPADLTTALAYVPTQYAPLHLADDGSLYVSATRLSTEAGVYRLVKASAIRVVSQPLAQTVQEGTPLKLNFYAQGGLNRSVEWFKDGVSLGATGYTLSLPSFEAGNEGVYYAVYKSDFGTAESAHVTVSARLNAPVISAQPAAASVLEGTSVELGVEVTGSKLSYQWYKAGVLIQGATQRKLSLASASVYDSGSYTVSVQNSTGRVLSQPATLTVTRLVAPAVPPAEIIRDFAVDSSFSVRTATNSCTFRDLLVLGSGKMLVWGGFDSINGVTRHNLVRFNADGSLDSGFPDFSGGPILSVVELLDGRLVVLRTASIVAGDMTLALYSADGVFQRNLSHLVSSGWSASSLRRAQDGGFFLVELHSPDGNGSTVGHVCRFTSGMLADPAFTSLDISQESSVGLGQNSLLVLPDGKLLVSGSFSSVGGVARGSMARLLPDGSLDATAFASAGISGAVNDVQVLDDGTLLVAGSFSSVNGTPTPSSFVKLNADGSLASASAATIAFPSGTVSKLRVLAGGRVLVAGLFTDLANGSTNNTVHGIEVLNADGSRDTAFSAAVAALGGTNYYSLAGVSASGRVLIGGLSSGYAWLDAGTLSTTVGTASAPAAPSYVLPGPGGTVYLVGNFTRVQGVVTKGLVRLLPNGAIDSGFNPTIAFSLSSGLVVQSDGGVVVVDGPIKRYTSSGTLDSTYNPVVPQGDLRLTGLPGDCVLVTACWWAGSSLPVLINKDGSINAGFAVASQTGFNSPHIDTVLAQPDGKILFGGVGDFVGGSLVGPYNFSFLLRLNADGTRDVSLADHHEPSWANSLLVQGNGHIMATTLSGLVVVDDKGEYYRPPYIAPAGYASTLCSSGDEGAFIFLERSMAVSNEVGATVSSVLRVDADGTLKSFNFPSDLVTASYPTPNLYAPGFLAADGSMYVCGTRLSTEAGLFHLVKASSLRVITQPLPQTVQEGVPLSLSFYAEGGKDRSIAWFKDGVALGVTGYNLSIPAAGPANAGVYHAVYQSDLGTVESSKAAVVVVLNPPSITTQPVPKAVVEGSPVTLSVAASGSNLVYQWYKNGSVVLGANAASLVFDSSALVDAGSYSVSISNSAGKVDSSAVSLTVARRRTLPVFTVSAGSSTSGVVGGSALFTATAVSYPTPTYQWQKDGVILQGAVSSTLSLSPLELSDAGAYTCVASNSEGSVTSPAYVLTVTQPATPPPVVVPVTPPAASVVLPVITTQPASVTVTVGQPFTLAATVSVSGAASFQWYKDGASLSGATTSSFGVSSASSADAGAYSLRVSNSTGQVESVAASVVVNPATQAPLISTQPSNVSALVGGSASFSVTASGLPAPSYQWYKDGTLLQGASASSLTLVGVAAKDAGLYEVRVTNSVGSVGSLPATLVVQPAPTAPVFEQQPAGGRVVAGRSFVLGSKATGAPTPAYRWYKNGVLLAGASAPTLSFGSLTASDTGTYFAEAYNSAGSVQSSTATLTVLAHSYAGNYSGPLGADGYFSLYVREDNTAVFLGYLNGSSEPFTSLDLTINDDGSFSFAVESSVAAATSSRLGVASTGSVASFEGSGARTVSRTVTAVSYVFSGSITASATLSGTMSSSQADRPVAFDAVRAASTGVCSSIAGFYEAKSPDGTGVTYTIVTPTGSTIVVGTGTSGSIVGSGVADKNGTVSVLTSDNKKISAVVQTGGDRINVSVTNSDGTKTVFVGAGEEQQAALRLLNVSSRSVSGTGNKVAIAGFVVGGIQNKLVLIRAVGPSLKRYGVSGALDAPGLQLYRGSEVIASNKGWLASSNPEALSAAAKTAGAFAFDAGSLDSALLISLPPGSYTAASTSGGGEGVALVEVYDLSEAASGQHLVDISTRAFVGKDDRILIAGFVVGGEAPKRVLIRAVGPSLEQFGLSSSELLAHPKIRLYRGQTLVSEAEAWSSRADAALVKQAGTQVGAFPLASDAEAAMVINLDPGAYSAQVVGANGETGIAIVEVYEIR